MPDVGGAEVEQAVLVDRAGLDHDDVDRIDEAAVVVGHLAEIERDVVAQARVVLGPLVAAEVPAERLEVLARGIGLQNGARPDGEAGADLDVVQLVRARGQGDVEHVRLADADAVVEPHAGRTRPAASAAEIRVADDLAIRNVIALPLLTRT